MSSRSMPNQWKTVKLGEVTEIFKGGTPHRNVVKYFRGNIAWAIPSDLTALDSALYIHDTATHISEEGLGKSAARLLPVGTVLLSSRATIGETAITTVPMATNQGFANFVCRETLLNVFLAYYLRYIKEKLNNLAGGSTFKEVTKGTLLNIEILLPPLDEQRVITKALSDVDGLLNALEALISKKRAIKQAIMQQLLTGKTRLPGFNGAWETKRLGEIAPIRNHKTLPAYVNPDTLCVELDHIEQGSGQLLEYAIARNSTSSKYHFFAGDVLFGRLRPYLRKFWHADRDGICTTEIWPLMVNRDQIDSGFLYAIVQSDPFIAAASISYGTHMPRADWSVMRNFEICLPETREQRAIASVLSDMDAEIAAVKQRQDKTLSIKQGMMQQLLTGRVRLLKSE